MTDSSPSKLDPTRSTRKRNFVLTIVWMVLAVGLLGAWLMMEGLWRTQPNNDSQVSLALAPSIREPLMLNDTEGNTITHKDLLGSYVLVFAGFTRCPDVCPIGLYWMGELLDGLTPDDLGKLKPLFLSIDPRDKPKDIKEILEDKHPSIIGLLGNFEQIEQATSSMGIFHKPVLSEKGQEAFDAYLAMRKQPTDNSSQKPSVASNAINPKVAQTLRRFAYDHPEMIESYDHSSLILMFDPTGNYLTHWTSTQNPSQAQERLVATMAQAREGEKPSLP